MEWEFVEWMLLAQSGTVVNAVTNLQFKIMGVGIASPVQQLLAAVLIS
jgi:hypothetical protein